MVRKGVPEGVRTRDSSTECRSSPCGPTIAFGQPTPHGHNPRPLVHPHSVAPSTFNPHAATRRAPPPTHCGSSVRLWAIGAGTVPDGGYQRTPIAPSGRHTAHGSRVWAGVEGVDVGVGACGHTPRSPVCTTAAHPPDTRGGPQGTKGGPQGPTQSAAGTTLHRSPSEVVEHTRSTPHGQRRHRARTEQTSATQGPVSQYTDTHRTQLRFRPFGHRREGKPSGSPP